MIPVRVREQDRVDRGAHAGELEPELDRAAARIDDDRLVGAAVRAHDVAVRPDRTELVAIDREH